MNNCVKILIYFIISILQCEAIVTTENPVIKLEYGKDTNDIYYVELNKSLQIIIKHGRAGWVRCYSFYSGTTFRIERFPNYNEDSVINITSVTPEMSTRWKCDIYQRYHGPVQVMYNSEQHTVVKFHFRLYVKGARSVNVSINGEFLNFTKMGLNVKHDGEAFYNFTDQQNIELVCAGVDKQSAVSLEYFNQNGEKIFEIQQERDTSVLLRTRLTSKQEKFHIDCIANTTSPRREYRYRIYFYKKELECNPDNQDDVFIVTVNGLLERYVRKNGSNFDYPPFKYIEGEIITVSCETKLKYPLQFYFGTYGDSTGIKGSFNIFIILGCISGILLIITIVGIVYWRKRQRPTKDTETPYNDLQNENEMTPIPESMYDSCFSENFSDIQSNNDVLKSSDNSEPYYHSYEKVNYSQCKPKLDEPQQRASKIYNEPYDHFRKLRSKK